MHFHYRKKNGDYGISRMDIHNLHFGKRIEVSIYATLKTDGSTAH